MIELTSKQLRQAANIKDRIEALQSELNRLLGSNGSGSTSKTAPRKKRKMSEEAKAKISAAQHKIWEERRRKKKK